MGAPPPGTLPEELWPGGGGGGSCAKTEMEKRLMLMSAIVNGILNVFMRFYFNCYFFMIPTTTLKFPKVTRPAPLGVWAVLALKPSQSLGVLV